MPFTLTDNPQLCGLKVFLSTILMIDLFLSNNRTVIFSETEKNLHRSKHLRDHTFMTSTGKGVGGKVFVGAVNIWPLNGLKLQPIQLLEELFFPSISSQIHSDCIDNNLHCIGNNHSTVDQIKLPVTCSLSLIFYVKKYYGLLNIASWLTSSKTLWRRKCNSSS